ncbi:MAG: hypothetical protein KAJ37_12640, partial [Candidatus Krumholzibacteria bacterium]|nr:hypothetical protein [Candidatus Krumholzibacteria bacterium]
LRQARAKIVQERSRVGGPLEEKVKKVEATIERLENESDEVSAALEAASVAGDGGAIAKHSRRSEQLRQEIDAAFDKLETATKAFEDATREFDKRLQELG